MFLEDIKEKERIELGQQLKRMKIDYQSLRKFFFTLDDDGHAVDERIEGASDLFAVFAMWIKNDASSYIGEVMFQSDEEPVEKILSLVGISSNESERVVLLTDALQFDNYIKEKEDMIK